MITNEHTAHQPEDAVLAHEQHADPSAEFLFLGGILALDLVNTEIVVRGKRRDLLRTPADAQRWWDAAGRQHGIVPTRPAGSFRSEDGIDWFNEVLALRSALRSLFGQIVVNQVEQINPEHLNSWLRQGLAQIGVVSGKFHEYYAITGGAQAAALFAIAHSAQQYLTTGDLGRLHHCENPRCILFFLDTTKSATRRWCSNGCMNRARSLQRYAATRIHKH
jgi:predicted RNA-binding Zn ribbon-like protein